MNRTSIKNKMILSFPALLLIVMAVMGAARQISDNVITGLAFSAALALAAVIHPRRFRNTSINRGRRVFLTRLPGGRDRSCGRHAAPGILDRLLFYQDSAKKLTIS
ncbi:MAG: hypothetical protein B5M55_00585 [Desulfococcus sp. 4484_242]|nr:MAG: hypothetical protein B5M55_00585 [Desulfococcus sp. 4484_242]